MQEQRRFSSLEDTRGTVGGRALRHWPGLIEFLDFLPFEVGDSPGERIRAWRTIHGVPRSELADRLGVDESTVWRWESGEGAPRAKMRERVEKLLGIALSDAEPD